MKVRAEAGIRALQNTILFSDAKSAAAGLIGVTAVGDRLHFVASDDFVVITDSLPYEGVTPEPFFLDLKSAKEAVKTISEAGVQDIDLNDLLPASSESWDESFGASISAMLEIKHFTPHVSEASPPVFAVRPGRFAKFGRIKTEDDYPLDFLYGEVHVGQFFRTVLRFKCGPTVAGVLAPVLRSSLEEEFIREPQVIW